jgi:hypothetical protein
MPPIRSGMGRSARWSPPSSSLDCEASLDEGTDPDCPSDDEPCSEAEGMVVMGAEAASGD